MFVYLFTIVLSQELNVTKDIERSFSSLESIVDTESIDLNDENFEHLTQASTGATTGDWFVYFYKSECTACILFAPQWLYLTREVSKNTDLTVNMAKVNGETSPELLKRFDIKAFPSLLYFRLGTVYHITGLKDPDYLLEVILAQKLSSYPSSKVPAPRTVYDEITLDNFLSMNFYWHCIWILLLVAFIAYILPTKTKTS